MREMTTSPHRRTGIRALQMTTRLRRNDISTESLHPCFRSGWRKAPPRAGCPAVHERAARLRSPGLAAAPAGPGIAVTTPGRSWARAAGQDTPRDGPLVYLACTCAGQRPDVPGRQRLAGGRRDGRDDRRPAGRGCIPDTTCRRRGRAAWFRPAAPSARAARYAALVAVSALVPGSPAASRVEAAGAGRAGRCGACR